MIDLLQRQPRYIMEIDRLKSFSDNIFGFAMTLLIAQIIVPQVSQNMVTTQLPGLLLHQWRYFAIYAISFLNIGGYWVLHHTLFAHLQGTDKTLIWLNLLLLLTVTFLPYPTALMGKYGRDTVTASVYGISITLTYGMLNIVCAYACSEARFLKPNIDPHLRRMFQLRLLVPLIIAAIGTMLSFFYFRLSFLVYFLVAVFNSIPMPIWANQLAKLPGNKSFKHPKAT